MPNEDSHQRFNFSKIADVMRERQTLLSLARQITGDSFAAEQVVGQSYASWYMLDDAQRLAVDDPIAWLRNAVARGSVRRATAVSTVDRVERGIEAVSDKNLALLISARLRAPQITSQTLIADVTSSIRALDADQRLAFVLHDFLGVDTTYIARILGSDLVIVARLIEDARAATGIPSWS